MFRFFILKTHLYWLTIISNFQFSVFNFQFIRTFAAVKKIVRFCLLLPLLLLYACSSKPVVEPPADLVGEDTIVQLIAEQLIVEALVFNAPPEYDKGELTRAYYSQLFDKYHITIPRYRSSLAYYFADKERMEDILNRAKDLIDKKKESLPRQ